MQIVGGANFHSILSAHHLIDARFLTIKSGKCMRLLTRLYGNILLYSISHEEPTTSADIIWLLRKECGLKIPTTEEEWGEIPRTTIDIRRTMVVKDGLREARKSRFDTTKLLNVNAFYCNCGSCTLTL